MSLVLNKLVPEDMDEKIRLNEQAGIDIYKLYEMIQEERLDFIWMKIRAEVQIQFYDEQLVHIKKRIQEKEAQNPNPDLMKIAALELKVQSLESQLRYLICGNGAEKEGMINGI